jgi:hypothetical protein
MPLHAMKKSCQCFQFPCTSDGYFEEGNIPTIITTEYEDQCSCRIVCSYPNSLYTIIVAQLLTIASFALYLGAAMDCHFVVGPASVIDVFSVQHLQNINKTITEDDLLNNATERGLGFFSWESLDGSCASCDGHKKTGGTNTTTVTFSDLVGTNWEATQVMAIISVVLSVIAVMWMLSFSCVASKRAYRAMLSFLLIVVIPLFQSLSFLVLRTDFCEANDCQLGGGGQRVIAAIPLSFAAGILLCVGTTNFPGNPYSKGQSSQRCSNLLFCRNTCRQFVMDQTAEEEQNNADMVPSTNHADVVEVPVESEFFDSALIDGTAIPDTPAPVEIPVASLTTPPVNDVVASNSKTL